MSSSRRQRTNHRYATVIVIEAHAKQCFFSFNGKNIFNNIFPNNFAASLILFCPRDILFLSKKLRESYIGLFISAAGITNVPESLIFYCHCSRTFPIELR